MESGASVKHLDMSDREAEDSLATLEQLDAAEMLCLLAHSSDDKGNRSDSEACSDDEGSKIPLGVADEPLNLSQLNPSSHWRPRQDPHTMRDEIEAYFDSSSSSDSEGDDDGTIPSPRKTGFSIRNLTNGGTSLHHVSEQEASEAHV